MRMQKVDTAEGLDFAIAGAVSYTHLDVYKRQSYNRLWEMLIDKNMKRIEMQYLTGISGNILARMGNCLLYTSRCV